MAIGTTAAIIGASAIGAAGSAIAGSKGAKAAQQASAAQGAAAEKAAELQYQATQDTIKAQQDATQQGRRDSYPWAIAGSQALYRYMSELGVPMPVDHLAELDFTRLRGRGRYFYQT